MELTFDERRVAGTLIEKGYTTPEQYPLTMNALVTGSNQKSCRSPVTQLDEERVFLALDGLRKKGLCTLVQMQGSRTDRWKHRFSDNLGLEDREIAVLGELLLRGPQTDGEIRQHASRMVRIDTLELLGEVLSRLMERNPPLAVRLSPEGRKRGMRFAHALYEAGEMEDLRRNEAALESALPPEGGEPEAAGAGQIPIRQELEALRAEVAELRARVAKMEDALGGPG
jgi:uncharacterized protein YceH (UPF0502 family)